MIKRVIEFEDEIIRTPMLNFSRVRKIQNKYLDLLENKKDKKFFISNYVDMEITMPVETYELIERHKEYFADKKKSTPYRFVSDDELCKKLNLPGVFYAWVAREDSYGYEFVESSKEVYLKLRVPREFCLVHYYYNWADFIFCTCDCNTKQEMDELALQELGKSIDRIFADVFIPTSPNPQRVEAFLYKIKEEWIVEKKFVKHRLI